MNSDSNHPTPAERLDVRERTLRRSIAILRDHKRLIVLPILVSLLTTAMLLALASITPVEVGYHKHPLPRLFWQLGEAVSFWKTPHPLLLAIFYLTSMLLATLSNVALYSELMRVYADEQPSLLRGLRFAFSRFMPILTWSLFGATVGLLLRTLGEKLGLVGKLVGFGASITWSAASVFACPILAREGVGNPLVLLRRSGSLVRGTWGDLVMGYTRLGLSFVILGSILGGIMLAVARSLYSDSAVAGLAGMAAGFAILFGTSLFSITLLVIYRCALYIYATEGVPPEPFDKGDMDQGWRIRSA